MQAIVAAQAARLRDLRQQRARESIAATAKRKTAKPNAVCELCGQPYRRGKKESRRRFCFICRPSTPASTSVRTIGGGLPTLGKGHW